MIENIGAYSQVDYDRGYQQGRNDAIDECINFIKNHSTRAFIDTDGWGCSDYDREEIFKLFWLDDFGAVKVTEIATKNSNSWQK